MFGGILTILEHLKVENVIISKQEEDSENYQELKKIVNKRKIKLIIVKRRRWDFNRKKFEISNFMAKRNTDSRKYFEQ